MSKPRLHTRFRSALVTGAGAGIGGAITEMLVSAGVLVFATSRRPETLPLREGVLPVRFDLADGPAGAEALVEKLEHESGGLDLVVHNAGYGIFGALLDQPMGEWKRQVDDMLLSSLALNRAALAPMLRRGRGTLVNVTSMAVEFPIPFMSGYNVVKAGLAALTESLMLECAAAGIRVVDFRPGDYRTGFNSSMFTSPLETLSPRQANVARRLEATMAAAPTPERAAHDLKRALLRGRTGVVRTGSFFQTRLAPLGVRLMPLSWRRAAMNRYFGVS